MTVPRYDTGAGLWAAFENELAAELLEMQTWDFLGMTASRGDDGEYVQFLRAPDDQGLMGECAGPRDLGGTADWTGTQKSLIRSIGWGTVDTRGGFSNYRSIWLPSRDQPRSGLDRHDASDAARLASRTLTEVMGLLDVESVTFSRGNTREGASAESTQPRLTGTERRVLIEALEHHRSAGNRADFGRGAIGSIFKSLDSFMNGMMHQTLIHRLQSEEWPDFDAKERLMLLDAVDLYADSGISAKSERALWRAREKVD